MTIRHAHIARTRVSRQSFCNSTNRGYSGGSDGDVKRGMTTYGARIAQLAQQQDPYSRIRFYKPYKRFFEKGTHSKIELHYLPFWNVFYSWSTRDTQRKRGYGHDTSIACTGISICAVQADHWASGIMYNLDPAKWAATPPHRSLTWLDETDFADQRERWSQTTICAFEAGYPKTLPVSFFTEVERRSFEIRTLSTFAFPIYRPIHRFTLIDQTMGVGDASASDSAIMWDGSRLNYPTKKLDPRPEVSWSQWTKTVTLPRKNEISLPIGSPSTALRACQDLTREIKGTPLDWEDDRILPGEHHGHLGMNSAWTYCLRQPRSKSNKAPTTDLRFRLDQVARSEPVVFGPLPLYAQNSGRVATSPSFIASQSGEVSRSESLRAKSSSQSGFSSLAGKPASDSPDLLSTSMGTPALRSDTKRNLPKPPRFLPPLPARPSRTTFSKASHRPAETPNNDPSSRFTLQTDHLTQSKPIPNRISASLSPERSIPDPRGWYAMLGIQPIRRFIDPLDAEYGSKLVSEAKIRLNKLYHPDVGAGADEDKLGEINHICEELKSISTRIKYSTYRYDHD